MILMIDNYDSFTYNLVQAFAAQGAEMHVYRNDALDIDEARELAPTHLVISPGPGRPEGAGRSLEMIGAFAGEIPMLGVCLGHQCLVQHYGGKIIRAGRIMHGKTSMIHHRDTGVFSGLPNPLEATRYHSLVVAKSSLPECLEITAWTEQDGAFDEIMGFRHREYPIEGVQFHPESIFTATGHDILNNFLMRS